MNPMILYYAPGSCAIASHIALEESGLPYDTHRLDFRRNEQRSAEYLAINPKGRVPALVTDRGIITETPAILAFIAQSAPSANLAPLDDPFRFAQMQAFNSYLCSTVHVAHAHRLRGSRWTDDPAAIEAMKVKVPRNMADCFQLIEDGMLEGPWVLGDFYSVADIYLYVLSTWLEGDGVDIQRFTKVKEFHDRMAARPSVRKVEAAHRA
jgi:glutathione S-transferase